VMSGGILAGRSERIVAPVERVPVELRPMLATFWTQARFYKSLASQIAHMEESAEQVMGTTFRADLPLTVLSAASMPANEMEQNLELSRRSTRGQHEVVEESGHWIQLDQPNLVIKAIMELVEEVRQVEARRDIP
jgi:pimeloyl-ACP methyl ester carboxylesterase